MNEQEMTTLMGRVGDTLEPDVRALVSGGTAQGRARRRRRTAGSALTGVLAVGAVAALGYSLMPGSDPVGTDRTSVASSPTPTAAPPTTPAKQAARHFGIDAATTGSVLGEQLDGAVTRQRSWHGDAAKGGPYQGGSVLIDGAQVTILLEHTVLDRCGEQPPGAACDSVGDGFVSSGTYQEPGNPGIRASTATYYTRDHLAITATAWNAPGEKQVDPVMADPVLSEAELEDLVRSPVWLDAQR